MSPNFIADVRVQLQYLLHIGTVALPLSERQERDQRRVRRTLIDASAVGGFTKVNDHVCSSPSDASTHTTDGKTLRATAVKKASSKFAKLKNYAKKLKEDKKSII
eukprot:SAG11_NODE_98_length_16927_cov_35.166211_14_plen_105_part_00